MLYNELVRDNRVIGKLVHTVSAVRKHRNRFHGDELADIVLASPEDTEMILEALNQNPELDDEEIAEKLME